MTAASADVVAVPTAPLVLSNGRLTVTVDARSGVVTQCTDVVRGLELVREPLLANNFRVLLPLATLRGHYIEGREQLVSDIAMDSDRTAATLTYRELTSAHGRFDIIATLALRLVDDDLRVTLGLVNNSGHTVEEVTVCIGGIDQPDASRNWRARTARGATPGRLRWPSPARSPSSSGPW